MLTGKLVYKGPKYRELVNISQQKVRTKNAIDLNEYTWHLPSNKSIFRE